MSDAEKREAGDRAPIELRVDYKRLNTFFADYTRNISKGGTFIRTTRPLDVGTEFTFILALPQDQQLELTGEVKWVVQPADATDENPAGMGIQFVFRNDDERLRVEEYVSELMHAALGPNLASRLLSK